METFQTAHDLANDHFNVYIKESRSLTHNVPINEFNRYLHYNNDNKIYLIEELNVFNKLHAEFKLEKEVCAKFSVTYAPTTEWGLYDNICLFRSCI